MKDDQSKPDLARTLYEQLITVDKVDLLMGPYATGAILSAMGVAQRYNKLLIHHTFGIPNLAKYEGHFPAWSLGPDPGEHVQQHAARRAGRAAEPAQDDRGRDQQVPVDPLHGARGARGREEARADRGAVPGVGVRQPDYGPIAARIKDANPDFIYVGAIGLEGNQLLDALKKIDYTPKYHFYMYPAPGPMATSPDAQERARGHDVRGASAVHQQPETRPAFVKAFNERAAKAGLPYTSVETQAAASWTAWQLLEAAVTATKSLDDKVLIDWLKKNRVDTIQGKLRFDGPSNYGDDLMRVKQVQNGKWVVVWPKSVAAPGATLQGP